MDNHKNAIHQNEGKKENNKESRRTFLKKACAVTAGIAGADVINRDFSPLSVQDPAEKLPWYRRITRWGQTNITETDPPEYDITWWRTYWKRTHVQGVIVNAGGIVAYYPSKIPLHRQAEYLEGRDLFGELCRAAHEDGLAVFARMDSNRAHGEFYNAHPDWFAVDSSGKPYKAGELFVTCVNSPYYDSHIPSVIKEIAELYHPEGFTDNSWSGLGRDSICYCDNCRKTFREKHGEDIPLKADWNSRVYRHWIKWNYERRLEIWDINNKASRSAGGKDCIWSGMNSGSVSGQSRSFRDYREICKKAEIIMLDSQARNDAEGFQQNAVIGKLIHGLLGWEKLIPESMAMYQAGRPTFRLSAKPVNEARMWMYSGIAGGIQPWWHHVGAYHEDRRVYNTAGDVMEWYMKNEKFLTGLTPLASVGVVWSQQNMDFFGRDSTEYRVELPFRGVTQALIRAGIPFLPVHADNIEKESAKLKLLILPNMGSMTAGQIEAVRKFAARGGNILATGVTSLYDEWGDPLNDFALADMFGTHCQGKPPYIDEEKNSRQVPEAVHTYLRLIPEIRSITNGPHKKQEPTVAGKRHEVLKGFEMTDILPFGGMLNPLKTDPGTEVLATFIPAFPIYPPETAWMRTPATDIPGLIIRMMPEGNRIGFMPADIDRQFARYNLPDHGNLLKNIFRWMLDDKMPVEIKTLGLIDCHLYRKEMSLIVFVVNLTNSASWRQPVDELIPSGPVEINMKIPEDMSAKNVKLLVSGKEIMPSVHEKQIGFVIDNVLAHEVAVIS
ncbi:MAG: Tat pathway signal protein [Bacteroidales bacterium]|nr:Tat pathway signal protein [Bacteroidales bacterium]